MCSSSRRHISNLAKFSHSRVKSPFSRSQLKLPWLLEVAGHSACKSRHSSKGGALGPHATYDAGHSALSRTLPCKLPCKSRQSSKGGALGPHATYDAGHSALSRTLPCELPCKSRQSSKGGVLGPHGPTCSRDTGEKRKGGKIDILHWKLDWDSWG